MQTNNKQNNDKIRIKRCHKKQQSLATRWRVTKQQFSQRKREIWQAERETETETCHQIRHSCGYLGRFQWHFKYLPSSFILVSLSSMKVWTIPHVLTVPPTLVLTRSCCCGHHHGQHIMGTDVIVPTFCCYSLSRRRFALSDFESLCRIVCLPADCGLY